MPVLEQYTAFELASRSMAAYNQEMGYDCAHYMAQVGWYCEKFDFANLTVLQGFVA